MAGGYCHVLGRVTEPGDNGLELREGRKHEVDLRVIRQTRYAGTYVWRRAERLIELLLSARGDDVHHHLVRDVDRMAATTLRRQTTPRAPLTSPLISNTQIARLSRLFSLSMTSELLMTAALCLPPSPLELSEG